VCVCVCFQFLLGADSIYGTTRGIDIRL
jgi:hypothetical protein